jgi:gluconokinase
MAMAVVIFGVSGAGKTTVAELLARELGWKFIEADDFHSRTNIDKMRRSEPLTDQDRQPWLEKLRAAIKESLDRNKNAVLASSAVKKKYRDRLRVNDQVKFVYLRGTREQVETQLRRRRGHFFNPDLLASQFADLEEPAATENTVIVDLGSSPGEMVHIIRDKLELQKQTD